MQLTVNSLTHLPAAAKQIIAAIKNNTTVAFYGQMGAGKTTLIKEICRQLGVADNVASPTFSLVNEYALPQGKKIYHFDFYRIKNLHEAFDMGYEEYFYSNNLCFIEWPEKIEQLLPPHCIKIMLTVDDSIRKIKIV